MRLKQSSVTTSSSLPSISEIRPAIHLRRDATSVLLQKSWRRDWAGLGMHFFITCRLTFCMSTFWLNSGGNFVLLRSFASTPVAMAARRCGIASSGRSCCGAPWAESRWTVGCIRWQLPAGVSIGIVSFLGTISHSYSVALVANRHHPCRVPCLPDLVGHLDHIRHEPLHPSLGTPP